MAEAKSQGTQGEDSASAGPGEAAAQRAGQGDTAAREGLDGPPVLDAARAALHRGPGGDLRLETGDRCYLRVACYRAFPLSATEAWIVFFDGAGDHIGVLEELAALDPASAAACREDLELRYVVPSAVAVLGVREEFGDGEWNPAQVWDFGTDRGRLRLHLPNLADHVRPVGQGRLLFTDRDERRCLLRPAALDPRSRSLAARYLWLDGLE